MAQKQGVSSFKLPFRQNLMENKNCGHHPHTMGYVYANLRISTIFGFTSSVWKIISSF